MKDEIKVGMKVRTADPLTECRTYEPQWRAVRRAGAVATVTRAGGGKGHGLYLYARHEDGTEAPYDADELTPRVFDPDGLPVGEAAPPDTRQAINRAGWAALGLNGGVWIDDATERERLLLHEVARLREVEAVRVGEIEAVIDRFCSAFGVTLPQAPARPGHLVCPMCTGKGQVPERVAWGAENGGDHPPWHRPLTEQQARAMVDKAVNECPDDESVCESFLRLLMRVAGPETGEQASMRAAFEALPEAVQRDLAAGDHPIAWRPIGGRPAAQPAPVAVVPARSRVGGWVGSGAYEQAFDHLGMEVAAVFRGSLGVVWTARRPFDVCASGCVEITRETTAGMAREAAKAAALAVLRTWADVEGEGVKAASRHPDREDVTPIAEVSGHLCDHSDGELHAFSRALHIVTNIAPHADGATMRRAIFNAIQHEAGGLPMSADETAEDPPVRCGTFGPLAKVGDVFECRHQTWKACGQLFTVVTLIGERVTLSGRGGDCPPSTVELDERSLWNHAEWLKVEGT